MACVDALWGPLVTAQRKRDVLGCIATSLVTDTIARTAAASTTSRSRSIAPMTARRLASGLRDAA